MADTTVKVNFLGDASDLKKASKDATDALDGVDKQAKSSLGGLGKTVVGVAAGAGLVSLGGDLLNLGTQLDVIDKKSKTVFEGSLGDVDAWAKKNASAFGQTDTRLKGLAANFGDLLKPMGFTAAQAASMSTDVVGLAGALSAWTGGTKSAAEVSEVLAKAMLGERDGLKELGISISEADVQARLAANGTDKLTGSALEQAKAVATQQLIFEKSADAQKAWADGSMDGIKAQNALKERVAELKEQIAQRLLPAFQSVTKFIVDDVIPAVRGLSNWAKENKEYLIAIAIGITAALVPAFIAWASSAAAAAVATIAATWPILAIGAAIAALVAGIIYAYKNWDWFRNTVDTVAAFVTDILIPAIKDIWGWIKKLADRVLETGATFAEWVLNIWKFGGEVLDFFRDMPKKIEEFFSNLADKITKPFREAFRAIVDEFWDTIGSIPGAEKVLNGLSSKGNILSNINPATIGPGGTTININSTSLDPGAAANLVVDSLRNWQNTNGPIPVTTR